MFFYINILSKKKRIDISINIKPALGVSKKNPQIPKQPKIKHNDNVKILSEFLFLILTLQLKQIPEGVLIGFFQKRKFFPSKAFDIIISSF